MKKHLAFTLTELLMALTIVGVLAVLTVPILINNFQNRLFATQIKNMSATIEQLAQDELITHRTRDLSDTDFGDPIKFLSDSHFSIEKKCLNSNAYKDCWYQNKIKYKNINKSFAGNNYSPTIILKNGATLSYRLYDAGGLVGLISIDVNGREKPNIAGRDYFSFLISNKGKIVDWGRYNRSDYESSLNNCRNSSHSFYYCYSVLVSNNWKMDY